MPENEGLKPKTMENEIKIEIKNKLINDNKEIAIDSAANKCESNRNVSFKYAIENSAQSKPALTKTIIDGTPNLPEKIRSPVTKPEEKKLEPILEMKNEIVIEVKKEEKKLSDIIKFPAAVIDRSRRYENFYAEIGFLGRGIYLKPIILIGGFGEVNKVRHILSGEERAAKKVRKNCLDNEGMNSARAEALLLNTFVFL